MKIIILTRPSKKSDLYSDTKFYQFAEMLREYLIVFDEHDVTISIEKPDSIEFDQYDLVISYYYPFILKERHYSKPKWGVINLHPSLLPYNRGSNPNVHGLINNNAGVSIHWIDSDSIDTGNILTQREIEVYPTDTGKSLYHRLEKHLYYLFTDYWKVLEKSLLNGIRPVGIEQNNDYSSYHRKSDLNSIDDLESHFGYNTTHEFINVLRARTFDEYPSAYVRDSNGNKVYIRVQLSYE